MSPQIHDLIRKLAQAGEPPVLVDGEVFLRTPRGNDEVRTARRLLPQRLRMLLLLVDGRRSVGDFRRGLSRYRNLDESLDMLAKMGLIDQLPAPFTD